VLFGFLKSEVTIYYYLLLCLAKLLDNVFLIIIVEVDTLFSKIKPICNLSHSFLVLMELTDLSEFIFRIIKQRW
jgi:hypothetical protein